MTRFGCMKHLAVLEEAGLITTQKIGREKFHYLNPVPIQLVYDRWVSRYAKPLLQTLAHIKYTLEQQNMNTRPAHVYQVFIKSSPEKSWQALVDSSITPNYYMGMRLVGDMTPGSPIQYVNPAGVSLLEGEVLEADAPNRLVTTFKPIWDEEALAMPLTKVTYQLEAEGELTKVTLTHEGLDTPFEIPSGIKQGWARILSGLKTLLETGSAMP